MYTNKLEQYLNNTYTNSYFYTVSDGLFIFDDKINSKIAKARIISELTINYDYNENVHIFNSEHTEAFYFWYDIHYVQSSYKYFDSRIDAYLYLANTWGYKLPYHSEVLTKDTFKIQNIFKEYSVDSMPMFIGWIISYYGDIESPEELVKMFQNQTNIDFAKSLRKSK